MSTVIHQKMFSCIQVHSAGSRTGCPSRVTIRAPLGRSRVLLRPPASGLNRTEADSSNPLEILRLTRDPVARAQILQEIGPLWSQCCETYRPSAIEKYLSQELAVWQYDVMLYAVQNPNLSLCSLKEQVEPVVRSMKGADMAGQDIWFLLTKRLDLLQYPVSLQRWLDFLSMYRATSREMMNFLLHAPIALVKDGTLYNAGTVVGYIKSLGVKDEYLVSRVVCACPGALLRNVIQDLQPLVDALSQLGLTKRDVVHVICIWPDVLLTHLNNQLDPFVKYLTDLGCSEKQVGQVLLQWPHLLHASAKDIFASRMGLLEELGVSQDDVRSMLQRSVSFLTCAGGFKDQLEFLLGLGFGRCEVRHLVVSCPDILSEKVLDLERKVHFLKDKMAEDLKVVLRHPVILARNYMQVIGPRYSFLHGKGLLEGLTKEGMVDYDKVFGLEDVEFCEVVGASANEYQGYSISWEEIYTQQQSLDSAREFQEELKKLGIYEGA